MGDLDLRFYLSILWRRSPYAIAIAVLVSAIAVVAAIMMPEVYRASGKILAEAPQIPANLARSTVTTDVAGQLQMLQQQAMTTDNLVALARKLHVYGNDADKLSNEDIAEDMRARTIFEPLPLDALQGPQGTTVLTVSFDAGNAALAADVVNELVAFILGSSMRQRTDRAGDTLRFFTNEVDRLKSELTRIEANILKFKNDNRDTLPDTLDFRRNQQVNLQEKLMILEREEAELRSRRSKVVQAYESNGLVANATPVTPEQQMLQDLNRALSDQLAIFAENSPNIQALRKRIAAIQASMRENSKPTVSGAETRKTLSPLDLQLSDIDDRLTYIEQVKPGLEQNLADMARTIAATPQNATTLNALERNRDNILTQYNAAVASLAEASTGQQIEMRSKGVRFSILEPAVPPESRLSPNRKRIAALGVLGAGGLGLGFIVLLELLNKTIRRPIELTQALQIQPLATIPYIASPDDKPRAKLIRRFTGRFGPSAAAILFLASNHSGILDASGTFLRLL
ncbi:MAG TPA: Wzz/FepE/Etk N-terminal domain-containing protein [Rhizobiaceae bacterium]|nr:Wzz/FepE/Etk N-terminal domain-containing protein [Rhizobiaceae bacterium]